MHKPPNILVVIADQFRADCIRALGNEHIHTPHLDSLVADGISFTNAYTPSPLCIPARYSLYTGCSPVKTRFFANVAANPAPGQSADLLERCGACLPEAMGRAGYRTFGIGKFHTRPAYSPLGFDLQLNSEELYGYNQQHRDAYYTWLRTNHPEFNHVEMLHGERSEMYYMPQCSPLPWELTVEAWAANMACEQMTGADPRPWFGMVSFIGPHPPLAPPVPFNRIYDPDTLPLPVRGTKEQDLLDSRLDWMNYYIWADDLSDTTARIIKSRYYGEITYIDHCIGLLLNQLEATSQKDNTLILFFSDHGEHLGDHHAWQKESFYESSARVPLIASWPDVLAGGIRDTSPVTLQDIFATCTARTSQPELRDGLDFLGAHLGSERAELQFKNRPIISMLGEPGTRDFKVMLRWGEWKYIFIGNGGFEQLFHVQSDPDEVTNLATGQPSILAEMRQELERLLSVSSPVTQGENLRAFPHVTQPLERSKHFATHLGIKNYSLPSL